MSLQYKRIQLRRNYSFTKTISMGQHQCPKCERQFARSDSLRRHLTSGICSEDMESETMSENKESTMSEESDAETSRSHQKEDIFRKYTDKIMVFMTIVIQIVLMKMMKTNIILEKRASLILGHFLLKELIVSYKTHSLKVYNI